MPLRTDYHAHASRKPALHLACLPGNGQCIRTLDIRQPYTSAIDWLIDQYRVKEDKRTGIRSDPNNPDDPQYIVRLVGRVVRVTLETVRIVNNLPENYAPPPDATS